MTICSPVETSRGVEGVNIQAGMRERCCLEKNLRGWEGGRERKWMRVPRAASSAVHWRSERG
jgi:hypothetical protein